MLFYQCLRFIPLAIYLDSGHPADSGSGSPAASRCPSLLQFLIDYFVENWLSFLMFLQYSYRILLDGWRLWTQRAHVDIALNSHNTNAKPVQQVFVSCNFCGKSISVYMQGVARSRGQMARLGTTANKLKVS